MKIRIERSYKPGQVAFLVEGYNTSQAQTVHYLSDQPERTNLGRGARLWGWCGETDNRSRTASGLCRVVRHVRKGRSEYTEVERLPRGSAAEREELARLGWCPDWRDTEGHGRIVELEG